MTVCSTCKHANYCEIVAGGYSSQVKSCRDYRKGETTNEEWLKQANTEQLADLMSRMLGCSNCPIPKDGRSCMGTYSGCWHEIIKWLKQPHSEVAE